MDNIIIDNINNEITINLEEGKKVLITKENVEFLIYNNGEYDCFAEIDFNKEIEYFKNKGIIKGE